MNDKFFEPTKDDKWMLASHLQKAIRRGLADEAAWAASHLHRVDRAYLAYRLAVIAVEDTGAGDIATTASLVGQTPWGAKRFGTARDETERQMWEQAVRTLAEQRKDRTPCDWMACQYWIEEFEQQEGPWSQLDPVDSIDHADNAALPWWKRGLFAWRAAGTDRFPTDALPTVSGAWEDWIANFPDRDLQTVMEGLGARQREAHPVFLPLALFDRIKDPNAQQVSYVVDSPKHGPWLAAAIDGHTKPGLAALYHFVQHLPAQAQQDLRHYNAPPVMLAKRMMFWLEGGHINEGWSYGTQKQINIDTRRRWLKSVNGGNGQGIAQHLARPDLWQESRKIILQRDSENTPHKDKSLKMR